MNGRFYKSNYELARKIGILYKNCLLDANLRYFSNFAAAAKFFLTSTFSQRSVIIVLFSGGRKVYLRTQTSDLEVFFQHHIYRELWIESLRKLPITTVVDAGANIGMTCQVFAAMFPNAHIYAIEPEKSNVSMLRQNCSAEVEKRILSVFEGVLYFKNDETIEIFLNHQNSHWSVNVSLGQGSLINDAAIFSLQNFSFGSLRQTLYKIDIEGSELALMDDPLFPVLLLNSNVLLELHGGKAYIEYFSLLKKLGISKVERVGEYWFTSSREVKVL